MTTNEQNYIDAWGSPMQESTSAENFPTINPNLKPCPFCGAKPIWSLQGSRNPLANGRHKRIIIVRCPNCRTEQRNACSYRYEVQWLESVAEQYWNRRVDKND